MSKPESIGEIISRRKIGDLRKKKLRLELIKMNWSYIAGETLAERSAPTRLSRGTLTVAADGASWANELSVATRDILRRTERILGEGALRKVKVQSRGGLSPQLKEKERTHEETVEWEVELGDEVDEGIERLEDTEMREALTRLLKASKSGEGAGESGE